MGLLDGKTALIFGVANERSIAWGIAQAFSREGAELGISYAGEALERRVRPLAAQIGCDFVEPCDVASDEQIENITAKAVERFGKVDILVHAIAFANREELSGPYYNTSRAGFHLAMDISVYSFTALAKAFQPYIPAKGALLTLTYYGSEKVTPNYNVMGVAKAALEASVRYLAYDFGRQGVRVNAISAGPVRTLAAAGVAGFKEMYQRYAEVAPLRSNITAEDVGNAAVFLCSDLASKITGEILFVDSGYNILGVAEPIE
ncbi:MAG: enoyl-ACP reductase [Anaerolineales bacterium]|nr:enoyl-ACP reductase [Anaerolineales bacterium]MCS7248758.1 enoyl-ACP reductase [Anaerolineales bacterium]MDW8162571.1 enoyl-ACP reductase [Anaerolineales bacterium]MDW8446468.1 enoyl-ACP reductase [Anaerolineales bacterium]